METQEQTPDQEQQKDQSTNDNGLKEKATQTDAESKINDEPKTGLNEKEDAGNQTAGSASVAE